MFIIKELSNSKNSLFNCGQNLLNCSLITKLSVKKVFSITIKYM